MSPFRTDSEIARFNNSESTGWFDPSAPARDVVAEALHHQEWGGAVSDYMTRPVESLDAELDIVEAAEKFLASHYRRFPVLRDGQLVGQISRADLLRALVENWH